jgi:hypothetical protein
MGEIPARNHELGLALGHQRAEVVLHLRLFLRPCVKVGDLQDA